MRDSGLGFPTMGVSHDFTFEVLTMEVNSNNTNDPTNKQLPMAMVLIDFDSEIQLYKYFH